MDEESQIEKSPYAYTWNNPIRYTDPDGRSPLSVRLWGGLRAIGGAIQAVGGGFLLAAPEPTGLTKVAGVVAIGHGVDDMQAGFRQAWKGEVVESGTYKAAKSGAKALGANEKTANIIAAGTDIGLGLVGGGGGAKGIASANKILKEGTKTAIQFGKTENQIYHVFRHTDDLGLSRASVKAAVKADFSKNSAKLVEGKPFNSIVEVAGKKLQYTAYKLSDGTVNIGRIHGIE